ncbi:2-oxoadipate dioxygenase/decarboxylase family protein [Bradyrhizobium sp. BR 1432]|uniref:2-oxoadipate dioxygenase/decarboxylase family protein n=1 Tax=Bradyrhizobium sp. BR 1432 TaxID=3447966 RepID=UPI003EE4A495
MEEPIIFKDNVGDCTAGTHTARFGEIEQRDAALTAKGRRLYDELLASVRREVQFGASGAHTGEYGVELLKQFEAFPDESTELRAQGLAFFRYSATDAGIGRRRNPASTLSVDELVAKGHLRFDPIVYEDFFQSKLGGDPQKNYAEDSNRTAFGAGSDRS